MARTEGAVALTHAERLFIQLGAQSGLTAQQIATSLQRSPKTIYKLLATLRHDPPAQAILPLHGDAQ